MTLKAVSGVYLQSSSIPLDTPCRTLMLDGMMIKQMMTVAMNTIFSNYESSDFRFFDSA
jgi:hypothetical protein